MTKHVMIAVDCSGSMGHLTETVYESLLKILMELQQNHPDVLISYGGFNQNYTHCFDRKEAKYLSTLPEPFAAGGTSIYSSVYAMFKEVKFEQTDDVLFVLVTDGQDATDGRDYAVSQAIALMKQVKAQVAGWKCVFVSLAGQDEIRTTAETLGYSITDCAWGNNPVQMLKQFVTIITSNI